MHIARSKRLMAIAATLSVATLALGACSGGDDASTSASESAMPSSLPSVMPSESATAAPVAAGAAADACAAYFELDLLNSSYAGGAVANGNLTEQQAKDQFTSLLKTMKAQSKAAVQDGSGDAKMLANAKRMRKIVLGLKKNQALSDLPKAKQARFAKASLRMQNACDRAGYPLPDDNVTARTAAGI
ncbi:MAG: hypothetical protein GC156_13445 [Actinomycetales bacterium]|nr:hypothetical protein [Actinomycetales bacterium]